jgi:predicted DNA-binding helix-hairpin-helix protein
MDEHVGDPRARWAWWSLARSIVSSFSIGRLRARRASGELTPRARRRRELALAKDWVRARPGVVDVNVATLVQLLRVPVIDGTIAGRIITVREQVGGFESLDEMGIVLALGDEFVEKLREWVVCEPRSGAAH